MKFLVLIAVVLVLVWLARGQRKPVLPPRPRQDAAPEGEQEDMVSCAHCGVHLPRSEALLGRGGVFCGEAHRSAHEKREGT